MGFVLSVSHSGAVHQCCVKLKEKKTTCSFITKLIWNDTNALCTFLILPVFYFYFSSGFAVVLVIEVLRLWNPYAFLRSSSTPAVFNIFFHALHFD